MIYDYVLCLGIMADWPCSFDTSNTINMACLQRNLWNSNDFKDIWEKVGYSNEQETGSVDVNMTKLTYDLKHLWVLVLEMFYSMVKKFKNHSALKLSFCKYYTIIILQSVLWQVCNLFQSDLSKECNLLLPFPTFSIFLLP
jgi:hypothetical protein